MESFQKPRDTSTITSKDRSSNSTSSDTTPAERLAVAERSLYGWGRFPVVSGRVARPEKMSALRGAVQTEDGLIARGRGRSYGDAACNPDGVTVLTERVNRLLEFDDASGVLKAEAGASLAELLDVFVPRGWMPPVVPGTKFISLGGAVAADIHGKNHHSDGSFSRHVESLELIDGAGRRLICSREENPEAFWATIGGMGLTGIITDVRFRMQKIPSAFVSAKRVQAKNLDALMAAFDEHEHQHRFSVAWIDCLSGGGKLGRGVLFVGDFAEGQELLWPARGRTKKIPIDFPDFALNKFSVGLFNDLYYASNGGAPYMVHMDKFFFPLDSIHDWNRMYGKRGAVQYQCLLPPGSSAAGLKEILGRCSAKGWGSFLAVLKRFGAAEQTQFASLSFPDGGYTLALDFPVRDGLREFAGELDRIVLAHGGRLYLAKDALMTRETFEQMYPGVDAWKKVRQQLDPQGKFASGMSKRLGLT